VSAEAAVFVTSSVTYLTKMTDVTIISLYTVVKGVTKRAGLFENTMEFYFLRNGCAVTVKFTADSFKRKVVSKGVFNSNSFILR
jgi:hypothetical protein